MVLVTGASGFLGKHLVRYLSAQGLKIRALYNRHPPAPDLSALPGVEWMRCDLLDIYAVEEAMKGIDYVYHCAAIVTFDPQQKRQMLHFNPESTANLVNQALIQGMIKIVHVSSVAALGRTNDKKEITEEEEWTESNYNSAYGLSKYLSEMEVWRGIGEGLNAVIVNPGIILGPGDGRDLSAQLMKVVYKEFPFYSHGVTSWVDVADVVKLLVMLMGSDIKSNRFIISNGNFAYRDICTLMAKSLNKKPPRFHANSFLTGLVWRLSALQGVFTGRQGLITRETANNAHALSYYSSSKLAVAFPDFSYIPIAQTIDTMARSFTNSHKK
jgi:nucleoside-diphosphate-sugar epimerase